MDGGEFSEEELESLAANLTSPGVQNRPPSDTEADFLDKEDTKVRMTGKVSW